MNVQTNSPSARRRAGMTIIEYVGCLVAVVGGMWIGAVWLGVDVERVTYKTLDESKLIDKLPEDWRPANPDGDLTKEEIAAALSDEFASLRQEIAALRQTAIQPQNTADPQSKADIDPANAAAADGSGATYEATLAYWNQLREIALDEAALQESAQASMAEHNIDRVFSTRSRVSEFAEKAVRAIADNQVDPEIVHFGDELADWYDRGAGLYNQAAGIWSSPAVQRSRARFIQSWGTSEKQRQNEAALLVDKAASLQAALVRRYGAEFAAFGN